MASRCQVAHDFTQRHVFTACGEGTFPAPRYLLKIGAVPGGRGRSRYIFSNVNP